MHTKPDNSSKDKNARLLELDREFAEFFINEAPKELEKLKNAYQSKDTSAIKFQAHKMIPTMLMMDNQQAAKMLKLITREENDDALTCQMTHSAIQEIEAALNKSPSS